MCWLLDSSNHLSLLKECKEILFRLLSQWAYFTACEKSIHCQGRENEITDFIHDFLCGNLYFSHLDAVNQKPVGLINIIENGLDFLAGFATQTKESDDAILLLFHCGKNINLFWLSGANYFLMWVFIKQPS